MKLSPLTHKLPSPLLPVAGKPIMAYTIEMLAQAGIHDIVICIQHMSGNIEASFSNGRRWGVNIQYSLQRDSLGDAGAVKWARGLLDDSFIVLQGDSFIELDIPELIESHQQSNSLLTKVIKKNDQESQPTGCYIFEQAIFDSIPNRQTYDIETQLIPKLIANQVSIHEFDHKNYWSPVTSFETLQNLQSDFIDVVANNANEKDRDQLKTISFNGNRFGPKVWAGNNNIIHPSVRIFPPVIIGDNCQVGKDVELGPYTVVGSNCIIDDEASIRQSTVTEKTYIGKLVNVEDKIITSNLIIDVPTAKSTYITDPFLISGATPPMINNGFRLILDKIIAVILLILLSPLLLLAGLMAICGTGRMFKSVERIGVIPSDIVSGNVLSPSRLNLIHFNTRRKNGKTSILTHWVEHSGLYRISELFGVLSGRLSLIGVKPLSTEEADRLIEDWQFQRYSFSAGFTGLWYTEQNHEEREDAALIYDVYYVAMRSFREDMRILAKTLPRWTKNLLFS